MNKELEIESPSVLQPEAPEFCIYTDLSDLPISDCPTYLKEGIGGVCTSGHALIQVFDLPFKIIPGMVVTLLPWQLVSIQGISEDFRLTFFCVPQTLFLDTLSGLCRLRPAFFFYMRRHIASTAEKDNIRRFLYFCELLAYWDTYSPPNCRRETIIQFLRTYYWAIYALYINDPTEKKTRYSHKEEIAFKFMHYIVEEHSPDKDVAYYAKKLNISPKTLTNTIKSISSHSAHEWIVYYTIFEIKSLLRDSSLDIKSIAAMTHFPDHATLSRYFRRYTGMTPSKYRESFFF